MTPTKLPSLLDALQAEELTTLLCIQVSTPVHQGLLRQWALDLEANPQFWTPLGGFQGWLREQLRLVAFPNGKVGESRANE